MKILDTKSGGEKLLYDILEKRNGGLSADVKESVSEIIDNVRRNGDYGVRFYTEKFGESSPSSLEFTTEQINIAADAADKQIVKVMEKAAANIEEYHKLQITSGYEFTRGGRKFGRIVRPLERVGVYIPGGTAAYPSTVLMDCIPAKLAGVKEIIMATPSKDGRLSPVIAAAAKIAGVTRIFAMGGAQAVAALAYGTESVPCVDKIVGPGNVYVAEAKRQVFGYVDIDMIAGPSEVLIVADETANPEFIAADMLSQLEHDPSAAAVLLTDSPEIADKTKIALEYQLEGLSRKGIAAVSAEKFAAALVCSDLNEAMKIANNISPEHLELQCREPKKWLSFVKNAGSVFLGNYTTEPLGDYFAGTNHVLPTNGSARFSSPLSVDDFVKKFSYLEYDAESFAEDAADTALFADSEGLTAHAAAVRIRLKELGKI